MRVRPSPQPAPLRTQPTKDSKPVRVAESRPFTESKEGTKKTLSAEKKRVEAGPGLKLNILTGKRFEDLRKDLDGNGSDYKGIHYSANTWPRVEDVEHPGGKRWNPTDRMPRMVFDAAEDSFPVSPTFDDDPDLENNAPKTPNGCGGHYEDGVVGGKQALSAAYSVTEKGGYKVETWSYFHATNKAADYHTKDWSNAQVFSKPDKNGNLKPEFLAVSWHKGGVMVPWKDVKKDADGRPVVQVNLGSHALQPLGVKDRIPSDGLQVDGHGRVMLDGKPMGQSMQFDGFQKNLDGVTHLEARSPLGDARLRAMKWGTAALNPIMPETYEKHQSLAHKVEKKAGEVARGAEKKVVHTAKDAVKAIKRVHVDFDF